MSGMFWIALELSNPKMGLITKLSVPVQKLTAIKNDSVAKCGNTVWPSSGGPVNGGGCSAMRFPRQAPARVTLARRYATVPHFRVASCRRIDRGGPTAPRCYACVTLRHAVIGRGPRTWVWRVRVARPAKHGPSDPLPTAFAAVVFNLFMLASCCWTSLLMRVTNHAGPPRATLKVATL